MQPADIFLNDIISTRKTPKWTNVHSAIQPKNMCAFFAAVSITVTFVFWSIFPEITPG